MHAEIKIKKKDALKDYKPFEAVNIFGLFFFFFPMKKIQSKKKKKKEAELFKAKSTRLAFKLSQAAGR